MRIKNLKSITLGKSKVKNGKAAADDTGVAQIAGMEEKISTATKGLEETAQKLNGLVAREESEESPPGPHGPIGELSVEPDDELGEEEGEPGPDINEPAIGENKLDIQVVQTDKADKTPPAGVNEVILETEAIEGPEAELKEVKLDTDGDSLNQLFSQDEAEENPLVNLINSLPDVTVQELMDDLSEIQGIIKEWQQS
jgi:hypothetical protein